jgi:hypothetical protein
LIAPVRDTLHVDRVNKVVRCVFHTIIVVKDLGCNKDRWIPGTIWETCKNASEGLVIQSNCM